MFLTRVYTLGVVDILSIKKHKKNKLCLVIIRSGVEGVVRLIRKDIQFLD